MQTYSFADTGRQIDASGNFLRYERETGGAVDASVRVRVDGQDFGVWLPGDYVELDTRFSRVELVPLDTAAGEFRVGSGRFNSSRFLLTGQPSTNVAKTVSVQATFSNSQKTVTNASALLLAANPARQYLLIQNNDPTAVIFVRFGASPATAANGLRIPPGGFWEWDSCVSPDVVYAIGSTASNANIVIVEGA